MAFTYIYICIPMLYMYVYIYAYTCVDMHMSYVFIDPDISMYISISMPAWPGLVSATRPSGTRGVVARASAGAR